MGAQARAVKDAALVSVAGPFAGDPGYQLEAERFIYYDGLVPASEYLRATASREGLVTLKNTAKFPITDLLLLDRRARKEGDPVGLAHLGKPLPPGGTAKLALLKIWRKGFFGQPGLPALHLLPRSEYDRMLSTKIEPKPASLVRVGIVLHLRLEGREVLEKRAREPIQVLVGDSYRKRQQALQELERIGPWAVRLLKETVRTTNSPEVKARCQKILETIDAGDYLSKAAGKSTSKSP